MEKAIHLGSVVYVRYWDHVLYKNIPKPIEEPAERETIGWLTKDEKGLVCIENDRSLDKLPYSSGSGSGLVLLKSCIIEIRLAPIQNVAGWSLIPRNTYFRSAESALQTNKRKIQPQ